jgi:hypothetical protein
VTAEAKAAPGPLAMARNLAHRVYLYAEALKDPDPEKQMDAMVGGFGERAHQSAQLAANLALVSIAEDLHTIRLVLCKADSELDRLDGTVDVEIADDEPEGDQP